MKKELAAILTFTLWAVFVYGCISFFLMEVNPKIWPEGGRYVMVVFGFVFGLFVSIAVFNLTKTPPHEQ